MRQIILHEGPRSRAAIHALVILAFPVLKDCFMARPEHRSEVHGVVPPVQPSLLLETVPNYAPPWWGDRPEAR